MPSSGRRGFTILEVVLAVTTFTIVLSAIVLLTGTSSALFRENSTSAVLDGRLRTALARLRGELLEAGLETLMPAAPAAPFGCDDLRFRTVDGVGDGGLTWSVPSRVRLELEERELANGADDDGDGLVDEGRIVLVHDEGEATERRVVIARGVARLLEGEVPNGADDNANGLIDEPGLVLELREGALRVHLTLLSRGPGGDVRARTGETSVSLRN